MLKKLNQKYSTINSLIGDTAVFTGKFEAYGPLRIDGKFNGDIFSEDMVYLGNKSLVNCNIRAKKVIIGGTIKGDVYANKSIIALKSSEIIGNLYAPSIELEDGVIFNGRCNVITKEELDKLLEKNNSKKDKSGIKK